MFVHLEATSNAICWSFSGFLFLGENYFTLIAVVPRWPCVVATVKSPAMPPSLVAIIIHCCAAVCWTTARWWCVIMGCGLRNWRKSGEEMSLSSAFSRPRLCAGSQDFTEASATPLLSPSFNLCSSPLSISTLPLFQSLLFPSFNLYSSPLSIFAPLLCKSLFFYSFIFSLFLYRYFTLDFVFFQKFCHEFEWDRPWVQC